MEAQVTALQAEFTAKAEEVKQLINREERREKTIAKSRKEMGRLRKEDKE